MNGKSAKGQIKPAVQTCTFPIKKPRSNINLDDFVSEMPTKCALLILFLLSLSNAQSSIKLKGWIFSESEHTPVGSAFIQVQQTGFGTMSDESGYFQIENLPSGTYDLLISCIGYETKQIPYIRIFTDTPRDLTIYVKAAPLRGEAIIISAADTVFSTGIDGQKIVISGEILDRYRSLGVGKMLQQVAGVQIESATGGSSANVRIHGSKSSQVLVLLDGQRLNNPQSGEVDLNLIPIDQIDKVEIIPQGNTALYGGNAFAGILQFFSRNISEQEYISAGGNYGSFENVKGNVSTALQFGQLSLLSGYNQAWSRQDFDFRYNHETFERENAWYRNRSFFLKTGYQAGLFPGHLLFQKRNGNRGLPSSNYNEELQYGASLSEDFSTLQWLQKFLWGDKFYSDLNSGYQGLTQTFDNEKHPSPYLRYKTRNRSATIEIRQQNYLEPIKDLNIIAGYQYLHERLNQKDLLYNSAGFGTKKRESNAFFAGLDSRIPAFKQIFRTWNIRGVLRYEKNFNQSWNWYPTIGMNFNPEFFSKLYFDVTLSESVRYPDFNSLFWKADTRASGNPELQPERNRSWSGQVRLQRSKKYLPELEFRLFSESISDLIYWHRGVNGIWQPRNLYRAKKNGIDVQVNQNLVGDLLKLQIAYNYLDAINLSGEPTTDGKRLIFTPEHTFNSQLITELNPFFIIFVFRAASERETVDYNSSGTQLPAYNLLDASVTYQTTLNKLEISTDLSLKNITNQSYELIYGYPMPGREFNLSIKLKWSLSK
jgi:outer membrane cobalamin receptor